ncbi:MAG: NAD(P)/FAD-dependent oxidoreductase [Steroidobacteraceae bacterium]
MKNVVILGTGMAGFGAAHELRAAGIQAVAYDKHDYIGGHTASHCFEGGWVFDEGPHISFTDDPRIQGMLAQNVNGQFEAFTARVNNYWKGHWIKHPAQVNLFGLPTELVTKILLEFVELQTRAERPINNYEDWLRASFGDTFAETFPLEYTLKYHTTSAKNLNTSWIGPRLYKPKLEEVFRGALQAVTPDVHYISNFRYPSRGGFVSYLKPLKAIVDVRLNHDVISINPADRTLLFRNGVVAPYGALVSSIPLPVLVPMLVGTPQDVVQAASRLACSEVVVVSLGIDRPDLVDAHWSYFYDQDICFSRLSSPHMQSPHNVPQGCGSLQAECYFSDKYRPLVGKPENCIQPVIDDLRRCGILRDSDRILFKRALHTKYANIIFDLDYHEALATVHGYLDDIGIAYCGRYGDWAYIWTDQSFVSGEAAARKVLAGGGFPIN